MLLQNRGGTKPEQRPNTQKSPGFRSFPMRPSGVEPPRAIRSQGPQPGTWGVDAFRSVRIVQIARIAGRIGRIGRGGRCQSVVTGRPAISTCIGRSRDVGRTSLARPPASGAQLGLLGRARLGARSGLRPTCSPPARTRATASATASADAGVLGRCDEFGVTYVTSGVWTRVG